MVGAVKNKANILFTQTCCHIKEMLDDFGDDELQIIVDRQGGRMRYGQGLLKMFGDMELEIIKETPANSSYELRSKNRKMRVHFVVGADGKFLPVSLASMISKYLRELLVYQINQYFTGFHPELKPTAGYWKDGLRFIDDLKKNPRIQYQADQLIRCR